MPPPPADSFRILCVCTGNVFRSRLAEHFLRAELAERLGAGASAFLVSSAGTGVLAGRPVHPSEAAALERCGLPNDGRPAHRLTAGDVRSADLVLGADASHRTAVLDLVPGAHRRTFSLREFSRLSGSSLDLAADAGAASSGGSSDPVARARDVVARTAAFRGHLSVTDDDIPDPWGQPDRVLDTAAQLVRSAVPDVVDALTGADARS